ncbi:hypothetical protein EJ07DRAFT_168670 [Lizonia empirigonia]|nr:hypothetical protein EJ07DRAFT_168670 [Lizonia empirigonia]
MLGGPVLPAIPELHPRAEPAPLPHFRPLYSAPHGPSPRRARNTGPLPPSTLKRQASQTPLPDKSPAKKQSKWTPEEDNLTIELRGQGMKWDDIAKRLPGRSSISCRLRYQNYLEKRAIWDEEKKDKLARLYARFKDQMWQKVATQMGIPWRSAESMHWQLGEQEMSARANAPVFQLHPSATGRGVSSPLQVPVIPTSALHGFTPVNAHQLMRKPAADAAAAAPEDLASGARTAPGPETKSTIKQEDEAATGSSRSEHEAQSQSMRSSDSMSQHSATGSTKREPDETASFHPSFPAPNV